jgi:amino acid adenylation domain-containing protein
MLSTIAGPETGFTRRCFHELFEATAARVPDRLAVVCGAQELTYAALNRRANQLAHHLRARGVRAGSCVPLCLARSAEMIVALLGIMKAGAAYVPLLPESPRLRLAHQLADTEAPVVVTTDALAGLLPDGARPLCLDRDAAALAAAEADNPALRLDPRALCYVIYTSGSTGTPKGVAVRHENLANYTAFLSGLLRLADHDAAGGLAFATVSTLAADLGNSCIFPALASGGCLHVISHDVAMDGQLFAETARRRPLDVLKITPSHLGALLAGGGADVLPRRVLITGGEAARWTLVDQVHALAAARAPGPALRWINHYGPTETTIGSLTLDLDREEAAVRPHTDVLPIGRPIANTRLYILDEERRPVPPGEVGELYIAGAGVTSGYLKQPEKTAERFLPEPGRRSEDDQMYRTGDRVRVLPNGAIEFLGRFDHQVKVRGFRVELGEIEAVLRAHPGVREAVVVACEPRPQETRLVAYVVPADPTVALPALRAHLGASLPDHMVPGIILPLAALPLNANGKLDRKALPDPFVVERDAPAAAATADSGTDLESTIAAVWCELLGLRRVDPDASFFTLGGDSLGALHMLAAVQKRVGKLVPTQVLFQRPTVAGVAAYLRQGAPDDFRSLVAIQPKGTRPPLFCVHGGGGEVFWLRSLALRLGLDQPFYGLQARREDDLSIKTRRVEEMAAYYLDEIRRAFPRGPYFLSGASFGGKVAFEMAHRLRAQGEEVALLALFDTWGPSYPRLRPDVSPMRRRAYWLYQRLRHHLGSVWYLETPDRLPYVRDKLRRAWQESKWALEDWQKERRRRAAEARNEDPGALAIPSSFIREASDHYVARPYPGKVVLFRSRQQQLDFLPDDTLGWSAVVSDLEVHEVPGIHAAMLAEPRVGVLVRSLGPVLARAQREVAPVTGTVAQSA